MANERNEMKIGHLYALTAALLASACGASAEGGAPDPEVIVITHPEAQFDDDTGWSAPPDPIFIHPGDELLSFEPGEPADAEELTGDSEYGRAAQALLIPSGYGAFGNCTSSNPCYVGKDKQIRPIWGGGPTTHPATPGVDYRTEMRHAIQRLSGQGTNWTIVEGGSTSHDFVSGSGSFDTAVTDGALGQTRPFDTSAMTCSGGVCSVKFNGFFIDLNPSQLGSSAFPYCGTTANCQFFAQTTIQHELVHGMGLDHTTVAAGSPGSFMRAALDFHVDTNFNQPQKDALNQYQP